VIPAHWQELALRPPRAAAGVARPRARLRMTPEDFVVEELLGFEPAGRGEHVLLRVRKRDANTAWVARELARHAGVRPFDVGFAGMKDRRAVTTQWFSAPRRRLAAGDWAGVAGEGYEVLEARAHTRKLPRGALAGNRFRVVMRDVADPSGSLPAQVALMAGRGLPNYFGPQRFGRDLSNLRNLVEPAAGERVPGFTLSAARSLVFNAVLAERVRRGTWDRLVQGDLANLDGRNSVFAVGEVDAVLLERVARLDIHPTGPMWGVGGSQPTDDIAALEAAVTDGFAPALAAIRRAGVESARRPLRLAARDLVFTPLEAPGAYCLEFTLRAGAFATTVIGELVETDAAQAEVEDD
jgi:tRNA pseudouridine13 synthase